MSYTEYKVRVHKNGCVEWKNEAGELHRKDGPAHISPNGGKVWYQNGLLHREDGPAIVDPDGSKYWYLEGKHYTEQEFHKEMAKRSDPCDGKTAEIDGKKYQLSLID